MSRHFTQAEIKRAIEAARAAGIEPGTIEVTPNGTIRVLAVGALPSGPDPFEAFEHEEAKRKA